MITSKDELYEILDKMGDVSVSVFGDMMLDRYIWGSASRISAEAPVPVVHVKKTEDRLGGAGNAVKNLRSLGVRVKICGIIGDDDEGKSLTSLLDSDGVDRNGLMRDQTKPTVIKTRIIAQSQQVVRIDREDCAPSDASNSEELFHHIVDELSHYNILLISDYGKGTVTREMLQRIGDMKAKGQITVPVIVDPHPANHNHYANITVAKPNRKEAEVASGITIVDKASALEAGKILLQRWKAEIMLITLGEDGLMILPQGKEEGVFLETMAQEVFDVSGAGDTVTAVFSAALATGARLEAAGDLANIAAGIVVSEVGTSPIDYRRLRETIDLMSFVMS